jgi:hypothetical protein
VELRELIHDFQSDYRYGDVRHIVHDFRECEGLTFAIPAIEELSATDAAAALSKPKHRVAVVTDRADVRAMVKAYMDAGFHPPEKLQIFSDIESARVWVSANNV